MRPRLVENWRKVITCSWSFWLCVAAAALTAAEFGLNEFGYGLPISERSRMILGIVITFSAALARPIAQASISGGRRGRK